MDNIAHTLIGVGLARAGLQQRLGKGTTLALVVASNLPDIDTFWSTWDSVNRFLLRRWHSHSLLVLPVLAVLLAVGLRPWLRPMRWWTSFGLAALGLGVHHFFDLLNSYGVVLLWPLSQERFEFATVFIVDPAVWLIALAPLLVGFFRMTDATRKRLFQASLALLAAYVAFCGVARARAETVARAGLTAEAPRLFPEPLGPWRFRAVVRLADGYRVALCYPFSGTCRTVREVRHDEQDARVARARATETGRKIDWFMAAPVWTAGPDGTVEVYDLRFAQEAIPWRRNPFVVTFPPGRDGPG